MYTYNYQADLDCRVRAALLIPRRDDERGLEMGIVLVEDVLVEGYITF